MKRISLILLFLLPVDAYAYDRENWLSTKGIRVFGQALTSGGIFGAPRFTTALLPTCNTANTGGVAYDTTLGSLVGCSGSAWTAIGGFTGGTVTGATVFTAKVTFGTAADAANSIDINGTANCITFEGTAADGFEGLLCGGNAGLDTTTSIPHITATQTIAILEGSQTFSGAKTFSTITAASAAEAALIIGSTSFLAIFQDTTQTPDTPLITTGTTSNSINISENADEDFDFNNGPCLQATCTNPHLTLHDSDQNVTDYSSHSVGGIAGKMVKTLTESAATDIAKVTIAAEEGTGGMLLVSVYATDGSTPQVRYLRIHFAATNDGGTTTCTLTTAEEIDHTPTGTLTAAVTCVDGTAAALLQVNAVSSLTQTTLEARSQIILSGSGQIVPQ